MKLVSLQLPIPVKHCLAFLCCWFLLPVWGSSDLTTSQWSFSEEGAEIVEKDNQQVIRLMRGEITYQATPFQNGNIEFDMYSEGERAFLFAYFREQSVSESEAFYLRTHKSNAPDTLQYAPVYQGRSAWQLYHGDKGTASATLPANQWVKVKMVIQDDRLSVWIGDAAQPAFDKLKLTGPQQAGKVTLRGSVPRASQASYAAYLRNIRVQHSDDSSAMPAAKLDKGQAKIMQMHVSDTFAAQKAPMLELPAAVDSGNWQPMDAQPDGVFEFLRERPIPEGVRIYAVAADIVLSSPANQLCRLNVGFSDALTLLLDDQVLIYSDASYRYAQNRQEGLLHGDQLSVFLPLKKGRNHLRAIIADSFGGWGFQASFSDCPEVSATLP